MKKLSTFAIALLFGTGLLGAGVLRAEAAKDTAGIMTVSDRGKAFTEAGITKAKATFSETTFHGRVEFHLEVYGKVPENKRADFEKVKSNVPEKNRFFGDWANELAKAHNSKGIFLLVCREGSHIHAIDDRQTDAKRSSGFDDKKLKNLQDKLLAGFAKAGKLSDKEGAEAMKLRDESLLDATNYVIAELKDTTVPDGKNHANVEKKGTGPMGYSWTSLICFGIVALLGVWLVVGIFRALANRGGGGGGGGYGGGGGGYGGGGGGGGGFMTGMLGGLFGGMAGMWMYNNMFGGSHASDMSAGQGGMGGGDTGGGDYNDTGAGDYNGGGDGGGSNYDEGGGDYGGGSTDTGGGGDYGGGDTGGGGDYGGGGDSGGGGGDW